MMKRRRKRHVDQANHERWMVSYADFITLLFAFFVVMYSISSVNEGKYRILSESFFGIFKGPDQSLEALKTGEINRVRPSQDPGIATGDPVHVTRGEPGKPLTEISRKLSDSLLDLVDAGLVSIDTGEQWLEIDMLSGLLFVSGGAELNPNAYPVFAEIAEKLKDNRHYIRVRGYTDNIPISTEIFPSNWDLSVARAATVVRLLQDYGIDPHRLGAEGYGEFDPIASNETREGRGRNRRVVLAISAEQMPIERPSFEPANEAANPQADINIPNQIEVIRMPDGRLKFTSKPDNSQRGAL